MTALLEKGKGAMFAIETTLRNAINTYLHNDDVVVMYIEENLNTCTQVHQYVKGDDEFPWMNAYYLFDGNERVRAELTGYVLTLTILDEDDI